MGYKHYVVNSGTSNMYGTWRATATTHLMWSKNRQIPRQGSIMTMYSGGPVGQKVTLCGKQVLRDVSDVFTPDQAGCRECRQRRINWLASQPDPCLFGSEELEEFTRQFLAPRQARNFLAFAARHKEGAGVFAYKNLLGEQRWEIGLLEDGYPHDNSVLAAILKGEENT